MNIHKDLLNGYMLTKFVRAVMKQDKKVKLTHMGFYLYLVEMNNRLRWIPSFGLPATHTMDQCNIGSKDTYYKLLHDLERFELIQIISLGRNQSQAATITLQTEKLATFLELRYAKKQHTEA